MSISQPTGRPDLMPKAASAKERNAILQRQHPGSMRARFAKIVCDMCGIDVEEKKKEEEKKPDVAPTPKKDEEAEKKKAESPEEKKKGA